MREADDTLERSSECAWDVNGGMNWSTAASTKSLVTF